MASSLGIGTTNPSYKLQVQKSSSAPAMMIGGANFGSPRLQVYGLDADANAWMGLGTDMGGGPYELSIYTSGPASNGKITFGQYNGTTYTEKVRIDQSGNVGIGTASPGAKLDVNGTLGIFGSGLNGGTYQRFVQYVDTTNGVLFEAPLIADTTKTDYHFNWRGGGTDGLTIKGNGNVGIGTASPTQHLNIAGTGDQFIRFDKTESSYWDWEMGASVRAGNAAYVIRGGADGSGLSDYVTVYMNGNVGIGTTSPGAKLHVVGDIIGNAQVFRAYMTADFAKAAGAWEKIPFNATLFNTLQGTFDTTLCRFTASRAGYYRISVTGYSATAGTGSERYAIGPYKNGSNEGFAGSNYSAVDTPLVGPSMIVYLNGSTDYVEIWAFSAIAATWKGLSTGGHVMFWHMDYLGT